MSDIINPNDQLILISGKSGVGNSTSLHNIRDQNRWIYLNCDAGKRLPFKNDFNRVNVTDPYHVHAYFEECITNPDRVDGIIIDTLTFLMDMYESKYVLGSSNTMQGWSNYAQFFKHLMQDLVPRFGKPVIMIAHTLDTIVDMDVQTQVPIKGALKNQGIEAYFSTVVSPKKVTLIELEKYKNDLLTVTEDDEIVGYKHVFQTRLTKQTIGERIRAPMGMFSREQTYINPDTQLLLDHLHKYYN